MKIFYNLFIYLFMAILWQVSPFKRKARLLFRGRRATLRSINSRMQEIREQRGGKCRCVWLHSASLGEFEQGRTIIDSLRREDPSLIVVVTFFSPSGYVPRANYPGADAVFYLPSDTSSNARRMVRAIKADQVIFVKYEFWYHYLREVARSGAELVLVSALFQPKMSFFRWYGGFFRKMLGYFTHLFVQDQASKELLNKIAVENVTVAGDTRFDRVKEITQQTTTLPLIESFVQEQQQVMVCGSSWPEDETLLVQLFKENPKIKMIFAPHNVTPSNVESIESQLEGYKVERYTQTTPQKAAQAQVLIIDCIGVLSSIYKYGSTAYIGGGFGHGIHNILEAATWGLPVMFGTNYHRFAEARDLIERGGAQSIANYQELQLGYQSQIEELEHLSQVTREYVTEQCGATELIVEYLNLRTKEIISQ